MVAHYTFLATDIISGAVLGELPVNNVSLDVSLNGVGNMSAGGHLDDERISNDEFIFRTIPGRTAFWAYRENQIVWGGMIWTREWQSNGKSLTMTGQTFESYAARRYPRSWLGTAVTNYSDYQCHIIVDLWNKMQNVTDGDIRVQIPDLALLPTNDVMTTLTVNGWDLSNSVDALIQSILTLDGAPDYTVVWTEDGNGLPLAQLQFGIPLGNPIGVTDLVGDYPGPIKDYIYNENASNGNNQWWAVGDGTDVDTTTGVAQDQDALDAGWPLLEGVNQYSGVTVQDTIDAHAAADAKALPVPLVTHNVDLAGEGFPEFGSYGLGDYMVANVQDPRFPDGQQFQVRVVGWTIQPPDEGQGTENITLVFDEPTGGG